MRTRAEDNNNDDDDNDKTTVEKGGMAKDGLKKRT